MARIPLILIDTPTWNSRLPRTGAALKVEEAEIDDLAESLKKDGQLTAIEVTPVKGTDRFELIFGSRRVRAAKAAGWVDIEGNINQAATPGERISRNIVENVKRKNLTLYEEARAAAQLSDLGLSGGDIATTLHVSQAKVSVMKNAIKKLPGEIQAEWQAEHPVATYDFITKLQSDKEYPTTEEKLKAWDDAVADAAAKEAAGQEPGKRGKGKDKPEGDTGGTSGFPVSQKRLEHVINMLSVKKNTPEMSDDLRNYCKVLVNYIIQGVDTPPKGIPDMPPSQASIDAAKKREEKEAAAAQKVIEGAAKAKEAADKAAAKAKEAAEKAKAVQKGAKK